MRSQEKDLATGEKGVFAGGDVVSGPASIIGAIAHGRKAASAIDRYLGGNGEHRGGAGATGGGSAA